ncbi:MAG: hypothetical protein A2519_21225 [Candidatus Raymondbacteria bacterium RIFOXYD12_FULL_49_13]|uniref:Porin n=1 Tax=Candidatus Raymondbacteria bacterium RIFOXYD12_FULL_49_13 TaxID=1817890 RepID=A0A1F7FLC6_UNCRA|nr:MAG: hypothetical protein A2519_21225 [Candidatus Raymondbacteria bacterium RIFOXYD12_FULL_49_13]
MKDVFVLFVILACAGVCMAEATFSGYANTGTTVMFDQDKTFSTSAEVRLEGAWKYGKHSAVEAHVLVTSALQPLDPFTAFRSGSVMDRAAGELMGDVLSYLDSSTLAIFSSSSDEIDRFVRHLPYSSFYPHDNVALDRALVKLFTKRFDLYIGRQMMGWGTGYAFNPTDIWNVKNPLDPKAPKLGVNALRLEAPFGAMSGISAIVSPGTDPRHSNAGIRVKTNAGRFDLSVCGMYAMSADAELLGLPKKTMAGADFAGQIFDVGVWAEGVLVNPVYSGMGYSDFDSLYAQIDAGMDYTFETGIYVMAEYYFNGLGQKKSADYSGADLTRMFGGEMDGFARHYLMLGTSKEVVAHITLSLFGLVNLNDGSGVILPGIEYLFSDNITVKVNGLISAGSRKNSEYGSAYHSLNLKVTGYF